MSQSCLIPGRCDPRKSSRDSGKAEKGREATGKSIHYDLFHYCQCFRYSATLLRKHSVFILYFSCKTIPFFSMFSKIKTFSEIKQTLTFSEYDFLLVFSTAHKIHIGLGVHLKGGILHC